MAKIVVIDDEKPIISILKEYFESIPEYDVSYFSNSREGAEYLLKEKCDLLISDYRMQGLKGSEVAKVMRGTSQNSEVPILFVSAFSDEVIKECDGIPHIYYMSKPLIFGQFEEVIRRALKSTK